MFEIEAHDLRASLTPHAPAIAIDPQDLDLGAPSPLDAFRGTAGNDTLTGGPDMDVLHGRAGDDFLIGDNSSDTLIGGSGDDQLVADSQSRRDGAPDFVDGGAGNDTVQAGNGNDTFIGGGGTDWLYFHDPAIDGTSQADYPAVTVDLEITHAQDTGRGMQTISGFEVVVGTTGADTILGNGKDNVLSGWLGSDTISGRGGADYILVGYDNAHSVIDGGAGRDTLDVEFLGGVNVDLEASGVQHGIKGDLTVSGIENISGSDYTDHLSGTESRNVFFGSSGDDLLEGRGGGDRLYGDGTEESPTTQFTWGNFGSDTLMGGAGNDTLEGGGYGDELWGGAGADTFIYATKEDSSGGRWDTIHDLDNKDVIDLTQLETNAKTTLVQVSHLDGAGHGEFSLAYLANKDLSVLDIDLDGDGKANLHILISGDHADFTGVLV